MRKLLSLLFIAVGGLLGCSDQDFVTDVPLRVVAAVPSGEAVDADRAVELSITFSEKLVPQSAQGAVKLESLGYPDAPTDPTAVDVEVSYSDDPVPTVKLKPKGKLPFSTVFRVSVSSSIQRARDGAPLPVAVSWTFRTVHPPALEVKRIEPGDGSTGVGRDARIKVTFSEPLDCATLSDNAVLTETYDQHPHTSEAGPSARLPGSWECAPTGPAEPATLDGTVCDSDASRCTVTFKPQDPAVLFRWSSHLALVLKGGKAADKPIASARATPYGGQLKTTVESGFHVENPAPLSVVASMPGADSGQVPRDAKVTLLFSEPVDCSAFTGAGRVSVKQTFDAHPRLAAKASTAEDVPGSWACTLAAAAERRPSACSTNPDLCRVVFTPQAGFLYEWSSRIDVTLSGGSYPLHTAPAALDKLESARATTHGGQLPQTVISTFRVVDPAAVSLVSAAPSGSATGVSRSPSIKLTFSEPPACASLNDATLVALTATRDPHPRITASSGAITGTWSCPAPSSAAPYACAPGSATDPCVVTFQPQNGVLPFEWSTQVSLALKGGAFSASARVVESTRATTLGGQLPSNAAVSFRVIDPPVLALVGSSPQDGATGVGRGPAVSLRFSEPPRCATLSDALIVSASAALDSHPRLAGKPSPRVLSGAWSCPAPSASDPYACAPGSAADPCTATFTIASAELPLDASSVVSVNLKGGDYADGQALIGSTLVESTRVTTRGGELPSNALVQLRIEDPKPQLVTATVPGNGATGVKALLPDDVQISLSEPVSCATVNGQTVVSQVALSDGSAGSYAFTLSCTEGSRSILLKPTTPTAPYPYSATFTVRLSGGAFGQNTPGAYPNDAVESADATTRGGQLPSDHTFSFRTEEPPAMMVKQTRPSGGGVNAGVTAPIDVAFSEPLNCGSVTASTFEVLQTFAEWEDPSRPAQSPQAASCTFVCPQSGDATLVRCDHAAFARSSEVSVRLYGGTTSQASIRSTGATTTGGYLKAPPVTFSYRVEDPAPLTVSSTSPNGSPGINVSANTDVRFTFDRPVRCATALPRISLIDEATNAAVAGTVACTDGIQVGTSVNGATVIFTPSAALTVLKTYRAVAAAGIASANATKVAGTVHGALTQDAAIRFTVAYEDLRIASTNPQGGAQLVPIGSNVKVTFNQDLSATSVVACTPTVQTGCNFWINEGSTSNKAQAINFAQLSYDNTNFILTYDPTDPANAPHLKMNTAYTVTLLGGSPGPVGANGVSRLPVDYSWTFATSSTTLIVAVEPPHLSTSVEVDAAVCVEFVDNVNTASLTEGGQNQITVTYTDAFGRTSALPLNPATPYAVSGKNLLSANYVCLNLIDAPTACYPGNRRLLYATGYTATVSTLVKVGAANLTLAAPFSWQFSTRNPPQITDLRKKNAVVNEGLMGEESEVPVNSAFVVIFAEVMDPATLTATNISVVNEGGSAPVTTTVTPDDALNPRSVLVTVSPAMDHQDSATGKGGYALSLLGGSGGVATKSGNYLGTDVRTKFVTSPRTTLNVAIPETTLTPMISLPVAASRRLHLPSATSETIYATYLGTPISGIIAQQSLQPRSVTYIANPTFLDNKAAAYVVKTTAGLLDFRGNPIAPRDSILYSTGTTPASTAIRPTTATSSAVTPVAGGATLNGNQSFTFTQPLAQGLRDRMLGTSYFTADPSGADGTVSLESLGGAGCPAAGTRLRLNVVHATGGNATTADTVAIRVAGAPFMKGGCQYALKLRQFQTASIYNQAASTAGCGGAAPPTDIISATVCAAGQPSPGLLYTGETTAPTLVALEVELLDGTFASASGASAVVGDTVVRATFNEPVDPATVTGATFSIAGVTGSFEISGNTVVFRASSYLTAGASYTVTLGAITDLAGNAYAGSTATFTVENNAATFNAVAFSSAVSRQAPYGTATLTFSERINPTTLSVNTNGALGSVSLATTTPLFGCAMLDADPKRILWRPAAALATGTQVNASVNPVGSSSVLRDRAGSAASAATWSFTP